jgi:hypothetical protein
MTLPSRLALHLAVLGTAMVTVAVRPAHDNAERAAGDGSPLTTRGVATVETVAVRDATPRAARAAHEPRQRPKKHHRARPKPAAPAAAVAVTPVAARAAAPSPPPAPKPRKHRSADSTTDRDRTEQKRVTGPTGWRALDEAIARIPTYRPGVVDWTVSRKFSEWGTADWYADIIFINPVVPESALYDVAVHEWSHELSVLDYDGDVSAATKAMNKTFGGSGLVGAERAADCMALIQGAAWTHYTSCQNSDWRAAARRLVNGKRL